MLEKLIRSTAGVKLLGVVLFEDSLHLREIARRAGISPPEAKRELDMLVSIGLLQSKPIGRQLFFSKNESCSFFQDLKNLYLKTEGVVPMLKEALGGIEGIRFSFIFGSMASGKDKPTSDIDLLVVGEMDDEALSKRIFGVQKSIGREINFIHWSGKDLSKNLKAPSAFFKSLMSGKRLWLAGDEREFVRIAQEGAGAKSRR
jgi:predicted nucleotidyltransferase